MENNKLENAMKEINEFIKVRMNVLLGDLIVQSDEYEETKLKILQLPFIQQIINEQLTKTLLFNNMDITDTTTNDFTTPIKQIIINQDEEHIFLEIEENSIDESSEEEEEEEDDDDDDEEDVVVEPVVIKEEEEVVVEPVVVKEVEEEEEEEEDVVEPVVVKEEEEEEDEDVEEDDEEDVVVEPVVVVKEENEEDVEEDEEEGVFEIDINNVTYFTNDEKNGDIYEMTESGDPGVQIGNFVNGSPIFSK